MQMIFGAKKMQKSTLIRNICDVSNALAMKIEVF